MILHFNSIGLSFIAHCRYYMGFSGSYTEPPEPGEIEILKLIHLDTGSDVSFLLDSYVVDQLYEDAFDAAHDAVHEEHVCAIESMAEAKKEESMCRSY